MYETYTTHMLHDPASGDVRWLYEREFNCWRFVCQQFRDGATVLVALHNDVEVGWTALDDDGHTAYPDDGVWSDEEPEEWEEIPDYFSWPSEDAFRRLVSQPWPRA